MKLHQVLQHFSGYVSEVEEFCFSVVLCATNLPDTHMQIPLSKVSAAEQGNVVPGAVFDLDVGYEKLSNGQVVRAHKLIWRS